MLGERPQRRRASSVRLWCVLLVVIVVLACVLAPSCVSAADAQVEQTDQQRYEAGVRDDLDPEPFVPSMRARLERERQAIVPDQQQARETQIAEYKGVIAGILDQMNTEPAEAGEFIRRADELLANGDLYGRMELLKEAYQLHASPKAAFLIGQHLLFDQGSGIMAVVEQAFSYLNASASAGNADAQHLLAFMYSAGIGVEQHAGLALTHEFFAAAGGSRRASMALGYRHLRGIDVPKSCSAAREYFSAAAAGVVALLRSDEKVDFNIDRVKLRDVYEAGDVPERDADVRQYYTHAAVTGDAQAQLAMGQLCFYGAKGQPQDYAKALEYFTKAHKQGVLRATAYLGRMHYHAWGVAEKDYAQALAYFTEAEAKQGGKKQGGGAAVKGAVAASCGLGLMHLHGRGVVKNNAHALKYFKAAAARGSPEAQFQLGMMYVKGVGVAKQLNTALKYFSLSSQQGYTLAMHQLALMYYNGQGIQPSCEVGTQLMKTVAERGASAGDMTKAKERYADGMFTSSVMMYALLAEEGFETAQENAAWILDGEASALVFDTHPVLDTGVIAVPLATPSATSEHTGGADDGVGSGTDGVGGVEKEEEAWVVDGVQAYSPRKRLELAGRYYKLASGQGNAYAARQLGDYAYYGALGEVPDYSDAVKHYLLAAERKDAQASFNLGFMHEQGLGVSQDRHLSKRYYDDALTLDKHAGLPVQLALWKLQFDAYCESWLGDSASQLVARDLPWESITSEGVIRVGWTYYLLVEDYILVGSLVLFAVMIFSRSRQL